jgi:hypothetical protein
MTSQRDAATARRIGGQGRILEALAEDGAVLTGTLGRLGERFGLAPQVVRLCILELADAGWITIEPRRRGQLTVRMDPDPRDPRAVPLLQLH